MKTLFLLTNTLIVVFVSTFSAMAAIGPPPHNAQSRPDIAFKLQSGIQIAGLFRVLDVAEDIDDLAKGNIRGIDPIRDATNDVEDAFDDARDEIDDFGDDARDTARDVHRKVDRAADDVHDWFD